MTTEEIIKAFQEKPYLRKMNSVVVSNKLHCNVADIRLARKQLISSKKKKKSILQVADRLPKILVLDIETAPLRSYVFNLWKQNISIDKIISDWFCLCWSAKWLLQETIFSDSLTPQEVLRENDCRIMNSLRELLNEADIVVTHNGLRFDIIRINTRLLINGLKPTTPYTNIDTFQIVKNQFAFASNKLDWLATTFKYPNKIDTDFELWSRCMLGEELALKEMERYNRYDVELLENVYLKLRPWIKNHPNIGLYLEAEEKVCPNCGSSHLTPAGQYYTSVSKYNLYRCECGALSRLRNTETPKEVRKRILTNNLR